MEMRYTLPKYSGVLEVITLDQAKDHLRIEHNHEDAEISEFIDQAVAEVESYTKQLLLPRTVDFNMEGWQEKTFFPLGPVTGVNVYYTDPDAGGFGGSEAEISEPDDYKFYMWDLEEMLLIKAATRSIALDDEDLAPIRISASVGYSSPAEIPEDLIRAVYLIMGDAYEYRNDRSVKNAVSGSAKRLMRRYRRDL